MNVQTSAVKKMDSDKEEHHLSNFGDRAHSDKQFAL